MTVEDCGYQSTLRKITDFTINLFQVKSSCNFFHVQKMPGYCILKSKISVIFRKEFSLTVVLLMILSIVFYCNDSIKLIQPSVKLITIAAFSNLQKLITPVSLWLIMSLWYLIEKA